MVFKFTKTTFIFSLLSCQIIFGSDAMARNYIRMAGSSTVYPFARTIAREFKEDNSDFKTPVVESTGTGGGFKLFCAGVGENFIDFANASRPIEPSEIETCKKNGVNNFVEIKIGYDGIVLANSVVAKPYSLTKEQVFLALAKEIPAGNKLIANPNKKWSDINKSLPNKEISVYGPPSTSGTRDAFVELVMEEPCLNNPAFIAKYADKKDRKKACHIIRSDGSYIEAGENDNLILQKLKNNADALGIFGYSFLAENTRNVQGAKINGTFPTFENIVLGKYQISRPLFIYLKKEHLTLIPGMKEFTAEIINENSIGSNGYLTEKGLIPAHAKEIAKMKKDILGGL